MHVFLALPYYLSWHYSTALSDMKNIWKNFIVFFYNFFSIQLLFKTLFSPWHRINESYNRIEDFFGNLLINTIMRLVGVFVRLVFIVLGLSTILVCLIAGVIVYILWCILPFVLIYTILQGFNLLTT
jgi:hypothetical protein